MLAPFTYELLSDAKNKHKFATSSGRPNLCNGTSFLNPFFDFSSKELSTIGVSMKNGKTELHLILYGPNSRAIDLLKPINPALVIA